MTPERYQRILSVLNQRQPDLTVVLEGVQKPHNLSAIQRTCDAVGVLDIHAVAPRHRFRVRKPMASGSEKWVIAHSHANLGSFLPALKKQGFQVLSAHLSERAIDYREADYTRPTVLLMGTERFGISADARALTDAEITVPMHGMVASLNVSVAAAIILYEAQRQRQAAGLYGAPRIDPARRDELLFQWGYPVLAERYATLQLPIPALGEHGELLEPLPDGIDLAG